MKQRELISIIFLLSTLTTNAQDTVKVNCYTYNGLFNLTYKNDVIVEYGTCGTEPAFYLVVFDSATCTPWGTSIGDLGNINFNQYCRPREEFYFVYMQNNPQQLQSLDSIINHMPSGNPFVIYTPLDYASDNIENLCPGLSSTIQDFWGQAAAEHDSIIVLFGIAGDPTSYDYSTEIEEDHILYEHLICMPSTEGIFENTASAILLTDLGNRRFRISNRTDLSDLKVINLNGQAIQFTWTREENGIYLQIENSAVAGVHLLQYSIHGIPRSIRLLIE